VGPYLGATHTVSLTTTSLAVDVGGLLRAGYVYAASASVTLGATPVWGGAPFSGSARRCVGADEVAYVVHRSHNRSLESAVWLSRCPQQSRLGRGPGRHCDTRNRYGHVTSPCVIQACAVPCAHTPRPPRPERCAAASAALHPPAPISGSISVTPSSGSALLGHVLDQHFGLGRLGRCWRRRGGTLRGGATRGLAHGDSGVCRSQSGWRALCLSLTAPRAAPRASRAGVHVTHPTRLLGGFVRGACNPPAGWSLSGRCDGQRDLLSQCHVCTPAS